MGKLEHALRRWRWRAAGLAAVAAFAALAGRFWHPYYGFTRFVQLDEADAQDGIREIREYPVYTYPGFNGYDGAAYAQIAFHPLLDSPELQPAVGNVPYRARRILASALAWLAAGGDPARIARTYAALNVVVWLVLAGLLWRALAVAGARSFLAWAGVMFSAGALHSVRLALTDLLAVTLTAAALLSYERGRARGGLALLAVAGLARETALAAVSAWWRGPWREPDSWRRNMQWGVLAALPLALWIGYVRWKAGPAAAGVDNFTAPVAGWVEKWSEILADFVREPDFRWLNTTTLLATAALTVQAAYILRRRRVEDPWWRAALSSVAMMSLLGTAVWEGHPGAATRVLLPLGVAFAVLAVRERAGFGWIVGGGLGVCSGVLALWHVPDVPRELGAGIRAGAPYLARHEAGWAGVERDEKTRWAWSAGRGDVTIEFARPVTAPIRLRLRVRAIQPRELEVRAGNTLLWRGPVGERREWVEFEAPLTEPRTLRLTLSSPAAPVRENGTLAARALSFALYDVEVR